MESINKTIFTVCFSVAFAMAAEAGVSRSGHNNNCNRATSPSLGGHSYTFSGTRGAVTHTGSITRNGNSFTHIGETRVEKENGDSVTHQVKTLASVDDAGNKSIDRTHSILQTVDGNQANSHESTLHADQAGGKGSHSSRTVLVSDSYDVLVHDRGTTVDNNIQQAEHSHSTKIDIN